MLTSSKFPDPKHKNIWLIEFYSLTPAAREFKDKFVSLAQTLSKSGVKAGAVSCESETMLCRKHLGATNSRVPTFAVVSSGGFKVFDSDEGSSASPSPKALYEFVIQSIPTEVHNLRIVPQLEEFVSSKCADKKQASYGVCLIFLTAKFETSLFIKALAHSVAGQAVVGEIRGSNNLLAKELGLGPQPNLPIVLVVCAGGDKLASLRYEGDLNAQGQTEKVLSWFESKFAKGKSAGVCKGLQQKSTEAKKQRAKRQQGMSRLTLAELRKKKIKELREIADDLQISSAGLAEKEDWVSAVASKIGLRLEREL